MQALPSVARASSEQPHHDRDTKPRTAVPDIQVLPSPPLTREASLASTGGDGHIEHETLPGPVHEEGKAIPRPPRVSDEGAPTPAEVNLAEQHFLRTSAPFLDMSSFRSSERSHSPNGDEDMLESPAEEEVIDISGPHADLEAGRGTGLPLAGPSRQQVEDHLLDIEIGSPKRRSIPTWETVEPPPDNNNGTFRSTDTHAYQTLRSKPSRPLVPKSSYYFGPPPPGSAYGSDPVGKIGTHHPREVIRLERDYTGGELIQFSTVFPLELEGRITPTQFLESINTINEILISAHSLAHAAFDNAIEIFSLQLSRLFMSSHYDKQMRRLRKTIESLNAGLYNPAGLNIVWPHQVAFLFMEIEYY